MKRDCTNNDRYTLLDETYRATGNTYTHKDHGFCQLCGHRLLYKYEIESELTKDTLWVGSECVLKFCISTITNKKYDSTEELHYDMSLEIACKLAHKESWNTTLTESFDKHDKHIKPYTPREALMFIKANQRTNSNFNMSVFKVDLSKKTYKEQFRYMLPKEIYDISCILPKQQKYRLEEIIKSQRPYLSSENN